MGSRGGRRTGLMQLFGRKTVRVVQGSRQPGNRLTAGVLRVVKEIDRTSIRIKGWIGLVNGSPGLLISLKDETPAVAFPAGPQDRCELDPVVIFHLSV